MKVRAKFKCLSKVGDYEGNPGVKSIELEPVVSGSPENDEFFAWTPGGHINIGCANETASAQFEVGKEYYVDFTPAEEA